MIQSIKLLSVDEVRSLLTDGRAVLVDIRSPQEYQEEHIAEAQLTPLDTIHEAKISVTAGQTVIFHCRVGGRTAHASAILANLGFESIAILDGGLDAWKAAGAPVV